MEIHVRNTIEVLEGMQYEIWSYENSNKRIAHGKAAHGDTLKSLLEETNSFIRRNCAFPVEFVINGLIIGDNARAFH